MTLRRLCGLAALSTCLASSVASAQTSGRQTSVAVLALEGLRPLATRARLTQRLIEALRGFESLRVVALADPAAVLGPKAAVGLRGCADDPCRVAALSALGVDRLVVGEASGDSLRLRLVDSSTPAASPLVRVTQLLRGDGPGDLRAVAILAVRELFPKLAGQGAGTLMITADTEGATAWLDGEPVGVLPVGPVKVSPGQHTVRITAPGHHPFLQTITIELGRAATLSASLSKNRSVVPLVLLGSAVGAAAAGLVVGVIAQSTVNGWDAACDGTRCDPGFTKARFDDDQSAVQIQMGVSNGLFAVSIGLGVAALVTFLTDPGIDDEGASR